jgi:hypothetical protein
MVCLWILSMGSFSDPACLPMPDGDFNYAMIYRPSSLIFCLRPMPNMCHIIRAVSLLHHQSNVTPHQLAEGILSRKSENRQSWDAKQCL